MSTNGRYPDPKANRDKLIGTTVIVVLWFATLIWAIIEGRK